MSGLLEYFGTLFVPNVKSDEVADISALLEIWRNGSPITLNYNQETFMSDLPAAILANFCWNFRDNQTFELHGIYQLDKLLKQEANETSLAQWCLAFHVTKLNDKSDHGTKLAFLLAQLSRMVLRTPEENHQQWITLAKSVINHPQIRSVIEGNVRKFGVEPRTCHNEIEISILSCPMYELRGFAGLDRIYVNSSHFESAFESSYIQAAKDNTEERVEVAAKMSLAALIIHELGHVMLRQAFGSFNVNTPTLAKEKGLPAEFTEMGILCETSIFRSHVDWNLSQFVANLEYMKAFTIAVENGTELPKGPLGRTFTRKPPELFASGVDMDAKFYIDE